MTRSFRNDTLAATLLLAAVAAATLPARSAAARPPASPAVEAIYRSVAILADAAELQRRLDTHADAVDYLPLMERGFLAVRLREVTGGARFAERARDTFQELVRRYPDDAWARFGLGLSLARSPDVGSSIMGRAVVAQVFAEAVGADPVSRARAELRRALALEPGHERAAMLLAELALAGTEPEELAAAVPALAAATAGSGSPDALHLLALLRTRTGDLDGAIAAADRALAAGADTAEILLTRGGARLRRDGQAGEGAADYFAGAALAGPRTIARYLAEIQSISNPLERNRFERLPAGERSGWLRDFWEARAALAGVTVEDRLAEHYARLEAALRDYRRGATRGAPAAGALTARERDPLVPVDDRGAIYLRHGRPLEIVRSTGHGIRPNETWVYPGASGYRLFHFVALQGGHDFSLVSDLFAALETVTDEGVLRVFEDRALFEPRYHQLASRWRSIRRTPGHALDVHDVRMAQMPISAELTRTALDALQSDTHRPEFGEGLPFYYDIYRFSAADGRTEVTTAVAVPGERLVPVENGTGYVYGVRLSFILVDTASGFVARVDTVQAFRSDRVMQHGEYLRTHVTLEAPPSPHALHRLVIRDAAQPDHGQLYGGPTRITDFAPPALALSDVVLAEPDTGSWERGGVRLGLVPPRQFDAREPVTLFYEIYHLPAAAPYTTAIEIRPGSRTAGQRLRRLLGLRPAGVRLQFSGEAAPDALGRVQEARHVTAQLPEGRYEVRITVRNDATGEEARSTRAFVVLP
jgi:hypothetical protein